MCIVLQLAHHFLKCQKWCGYTMRRICDWESENTYGTVHIRQLLLQKYVCSSVTGTIILKPNHLLRCCHCAFRGIHSEAPDLKKTFTTLSSGFVCWNVHRQTANCAFCSLLQRHVDFLKCFCINIVRTSDFECYRGACCVDTFKLPLFPKFFLFQNHKQYFHLLNYNQCTCAPFVMVIHNPSVAVSEV